MKAIHTVPFTLDGRVFLPVHLDGRGPYCFMLDTGAVGWNLQNGKRSEMATAEQRVAPLPRDPQAGQKEVAPLGSALMAP